jgi:glutathione S-transferase
MLLYNAPVSGNCYKVRLLFAQLGIAYERQEVDVFDRSDRPELLGGLNPALRVPTLVLDDGRPLAESNAILFYFGEETDYVPPDRYERAQVLQWLFFEQYEVEPNIAVARFWELAGIHQPDAELEAKHKGGDAALRALDVRLHARGTRGRVHARALPRGQLVADPGRRPTGPHRHGGLNSLGTPARGCPSSRRPLAPGRRGRPLGRVRSTYARPTSHDPFFVISQAASSGADHHSPPDHGDRGDGFPGVWRIGASRWTCHAGPGRTQLHSNRLDGRRVCVRAR